jgi:hypothetical protein
MQKEIRITCEGAGLIDFSSLEPFQDNLKDLHKSEFEKLKHSIIKYGITCPFFLWKNKCLDGHQRIRVLGEMLKDGYALPDGKVPFVEIEAKDTKEAKEKILLFTSQYGKISGDSLYEFLSLEGLSLDDIKMDVELPEIDFGKFEAEFFKDSTGGDGIDHQSLADRFIIPPFSVLDARQGYWQDRKKAWLALGIKSELGRGGWANDVSETGNNGESKLLSQSTRGGVRSHSG